ncbi:hypothetical protein, partial [Nostoc sp. UHCC 0251]|uniref:hypothetical protein n=1 Tax=Nostoc sp. UHCC 0251 TaxID=3110240 RepID=UPI002B218189
KSRTAFLSRLGMNSESHSSSPLKWTKSNDSRASKVHITSKRELLHTVPDKLKIQSPKTRVNVKAKWKHDDKNL